MMSYTAKTVLFDAFDHNRRQIYKNTYPSNAHSHMMSNTGTPVLFDAFEP